MREPFATTRWSLVAAARGEDSRARVALGELLQAYWSPVHAYLRRRGASDADARDLTQGFFARLLERDDLQAVDASCGRFRSWLLTCVQHYAANEVRGARAEKRGGGRVLVLAFDEESGGDQEVVDSETPEWHFDRAWARALLRRARKRLDREYGEGRKAERYAALVSVLDDDADRPAYAALAERLGTTEGSIKVFVHQMRQRFGALIRREIADTLPAGSDAEAVESELADLFRVLGRSS